VASALALPIYNSSVSPRSICHLANPAPLLIGVYCTSLPCSRYGYELGRVSKVANALDVLEGRDAIRLSLSCERRPVHRLLIPERSGLTVVPATSTIRRTTGWQPSASLVEQRRRTWRNGEWSVQLTCPIFLMSGRGRLEAMARVSSDKQSGVNRMALGRRTRRFVVRLKVSEVVRNFHSSTALRCPISVVNTCVLVFTLPRSSGTSSPLPTRTKHTSPRPPSAQLSDLRTLHAYTLSRQADHQSQSHT